MSPDLTLADFLNAVEAEAGEPLTDLHYVAGHAPRFQVKGSPSLYLGAETTAREIGGEIRRRRAEEAIGPLSLPLGRLELPVTVRVRAIRALRDRGVKTVGDLTRMTFPELRSVPRLGPASRVGVIRALTKLGLSLADKGGDS